ncbi:MAG: hypothetical protein COA32_16520 [Fluviicola sp.]|nr:MAG: hypothetical protein COA32_16520 [Fluviicola sp.]
MSVDSKTIVNEMQPYVDEILDTPNCRYLSWEHCYNAFGNNNLDDDTLALHLGFYLASWGMYRGSTHLLQRDYQFHIPIVKKIKEFKELRCERNAEITEKYIPRILELKEQIIKGYKGFNPSETLITKIILGTLGSVPALDRYFIVGARKEPNKIHGYTLNKKLMVRLTDFIIDHKEAIEEVQVKLEGRNIYYPYMKIVDMYFWQLGFNMEEAKK